MKTGFYPRRIVLCKRIISQSNLKPKKSKNIFLYSFSNRIPAQITFRIGSELYGSGGSVVKVQRIVVHEDYDSRTIDFDYSLLQLSQPLNFSDQIKPIALPSVDDEVADGTFCLISGWGNTQNSSESRTKLRGAEVPIVNQEKCVEAYRSTNTVTPRMICAGFEQGGKDCEQIIHELFIFFY